MFVDMASSWRLDGPNTAVSLLCKVCDNDSFLDGRVIRYNIEVLELV